MQDERTGNNERIISAVIGKNLAEATDVLSGFGIDIIDTVTTCGGKLTKLDSRRVINAEITGTGARLILTDFLLNI